MSMLYQRSYLKFITINTLALIVNSVNVYARSIAIEKDNNNNDGQKSLKIPTIVCIVGVVAVVASGGFCLFSSKKQKRVSEEFLTKDNSSNNSSSSTSRSSSDSELHQLKGNTEKEIKEFRGEIDLNDIKIDQLKEDVNNEDELSKRSDSSSNSNKQQNKRKSILSNFRLKSKKENRKSQVQIVDDCSSVYTNDDWINEQKYQAHLNKENQQGYDDLYEDEDEEVNSNDGFWNSELEPIQSSTNKAQESYAIPSLAGNRNSVIVKSGNEKKLASKRQSVIIIDDDDAEYGDKSIRTCSSLDSNGCPANQKPTRVKSWRNNDYVKELKELMENIEETDSNSYLPSQ